MFQASLWGIEQNKILLQNQNIYLTDQGGNQGDWVLKNGNNILTTFSCQDVQKLLNRDAKFTSQEKVLKNLNSPLSVQDKEFTYSFWLYSNPPYLAAFNHSNNKIYVITGESNKSLFELVKNYEGCNMAGEIPLPTLNSENVTDDNVGKIAVTINAVYLG